MIYWVCCTTLTGSQLIKPTLQGLPRAGCRGRKESPTRPTHPLAPSPALLSHLSPQHHVRPQLQQRPRLHVLLLLLAMLPTPVPGCRVRTEPMLRCQEGIFFSQIRLPGTVAEAASGSRAVGKPALLPGAAACEPSVPRAGAARRSRTPAARRGTRSAPGTAFRHHLYFVFATTLQVNSRYPACQRLTCCDIPSYDKS